MVSHRTRRSHSRRSHRRGRRMRGGSSVPAPYESLKSTPMPVNQSAGKRRRRGGYLGGIVHQAAVPIALLGMQQTYRKKGSRTRQTRKYRR